MARSNLTATHRLFAEKREALATVILPRMGRVMGNVIAKEARERCVSDEVRPSIKVKVESDARGKVRVTILTSGKGAYMAPWLEWGTDPHFIIARGMREAGGVALRGAVNRANEQSKESRTLVISARFAGAIVLHPGAQPREFMRPALDHGMAEALRRGQRYATRAVRVLDTAEDEE